MPKSKQKRILLISGYDAASHKHWRQILQKNLPQYDWTQIALPDRYYAWRIRGNGLTLASQYKDLLSQNYDCLIVTSMVDLNSLRGFIPNLAEIPTIYYCHENQFVYPKTDQPQDASNRLNAQLSAIYGMWSADKVVFNSQYNRQTFLQGAKQLVKRLPDGVPKSLIDKITKVSSVLPVPISSPLVSVQSSRAAPSNNDRIIEIVWNHRWEFDKQPEVLFSALRTFKARGFRFKLHLLGQSFRKIPACFEANKDYFESEIETWGFQSIERYRAILSRADIVVSTALHDFQGLSMLEAISYGCQPIAPNRVAYPEYIEPEDLYCVTQREDESVNLCCKLEEIYQRFQKSGFKISPNYRKKSSSYDIQVLAYHYQALFDSMMVSPF